MGRELSGNGGMPTESFPCPWNSQIEAVKRSESERREGGRERRKREDTLSYIVEPSTGLT